MASATLRPEVTLLSDRDRDISRSSGSTMASSELLSGHDVSIYDRDGRRRAGEIVVFADRPLVEQSIPAWVLPTAEALADLMELPAGWNSYRSKPIDQRSIHCAVALLGRVMEANTPSPIVVPTVSGGVQLEWHQNGVDVEITIDAIGRIEAYAHSNRTGQEFDGSWGEVEHQIVDLIVNDLSR